MTRLFLLLFGLWGLGLCACRNTEVVASPPLLDDGQLAKVQAAQEGELKRTLGGRLRYHRELKTVAHADSLAVTLPSAGSLASSLIRLVLRYPSLFGSPSSDQFESVETTTESDGSRAITLRQKSQDVTIWGSFLRGHLDRAGKLKRIVAHTVPLLSWRAEAAIPQISTEAARQESLRILTAERPLVAFSAQTPKLYYFPVEKQLFLVYRVEVSGQDGDLPIRLALFLSAHTLSLLWREDLVISTDVPMSTIGRGTGVLGESFELSITQRGDSYSLEDIRRGSARATVAKAAERLPGKTVQSDRVDGWDVPSAVSAYAHLALLWDYFSTTHKFFGWDGSGHGIVVATHSEVRFPPLPVALFDGQRIVLGAGSPPSLLPAGGAFDVVAHEYAHAVIRATADLAAEGESGAIDEGLANIFACLSEHAVGIARPNWTVGDSIYRPLTGTAALADLEDPRRTEQARFATDKVPVELRLASSPVLTDRSLRRFRAGYIGHVGFLISAKLGPAKTARLYFRAITTYLHRYADATDLADATIAASTDLFADSESVQAAWDSAGVSDYLR